MIPINIPLKLRGKATQEEYLEKLAEEHYLFIQDRLSKFSKVDEWLCTENIIIDEVPIDFKGIIKAKPKVLRDIKNEIDKRKLENKYWGTEEVLTKNKKGDVIITHKNFEVLNCILVFYGDKLIKSDFVKKLNLTVCPYCNRAYINYAIDGAENKKVTSEIDHFFNKSDYPLLALSFYNLMPSCKVCNFLKKQNELSKSVYEIEHHKDSLEFSYDIHSTDFMSNIDSFSITISSSDNQMNKNIENLYLKSLYKIHKDYLQEIFIKNEIYTDELIDEIINNYEDIFSDRSEIYNLLYGNYLDNDLSNRPLSKLTIDILDELKSY